MRFIDKAIKTAYELFPSTYRDNKIFSGQAYHFAFSFKRNNLLAIGQNEYSINMKPIYFGNKFGIPHQVKYPYKHAEVDCISRMWGRYHIDSSIKLVVLRLNRRGELCNSKPCISCSQLLNAICINKVWYSDANGDIING